LQITSTAPRRRMILHFSHIGLTEARTFKISVLITLGDGREAGSSTSLSSRNSRLGEFRLS